jgi:glucosamine--fructose-6-phosphate aminotransferase (isomerizing)
VTTDHRGQHALAEIANQANPWADTLRLVEHKTGRIQRLAESVDEVIFTGCGSALNVSWAVAPIFQQVTGIRARAAAAGDCAFFPATVFGPGETLVVAISRSGDTTETVLACRAALDRGMRALAITCYPESQLVAMADEALVLEAANEKSVVTTRSLTSMVLCGQAMSAVIAGDGGMMASLRTLPAFAEGAGEAARRLGRELAENAVITKFSFVGSGPYYGLARECQLKTKETCLLPSDSYPVLEYRHGPKSNVDEHMLVTVLMSDRAYDEEVHFIRDMKALGGHVLALCDQASPAVREAADAVYETETGLDDLVRGALYMPPVQFMAVYRSLKQGFNPDEPVNLTYWVALPGEH